jgi:hypothetical protein
MVLDDLLHSYSRGPEAFSTCTPVVNLCLVQDLLNFSLVAETVDDLKIGLQPFIIADGSAEHRQANLELARTYGLLNSGKQPLLLADMEAFKIQGSTIHPIDLLQSGMQPRHVWKFSGHGLGANTPTHNCLPSLLDTIITKVPIRTTADN